MATHSDAGVEGPYFVEKDAHGCSTCGHGTYWTVVGPDGVALGQSWGDEEVADDICEHLNDAYHAGLTTAQRTIEGLRAERDKLLKRLAPQEQHDGGTVDTIDLMSFEATLRTEERDEARRERDEARARIAALENQWKRAFEGRGSRQG